MKRRVLVTGSKGFTGIYVCQEFTNAGWEVWGAGLQADPNLSNFLPIDLHDRESLASIADTVKPSVVIHLAANAFVGHGDPTAFYSTNTLGTRNLLDALDRASHTPDRVILASSANIYGNRREGKINELTQPDPRNDYAVSKLAMEYVARLWSDKLPIIITRPFNYTGVGQNNNFLVPKIVAHFKSRCAVIKLGNIDVSRDFSDVRDIARYYFFLANHGPIGETLNLCSGEASTLSELLDYAAELSGHRITLETDRALVRENEVKVLLGDRDKLSRLMGTSEGISIFDTLRWMLET